MTTRIRSNGSTWNKQPVDPIAALKERLSIHTLDPRFEKLGNFILPGKDGFTHFYGNFYDMSALFDILTDEKELIDSLTFLIRQNQLTPGYLRAKIEREEAA